MMMRFLRHAFAAVALLALTLPAKANITFNFEAGGTGLPAASDYATATLTLITSGGTCTVADACILVNLTTEPGFLFWTQSTAEATIAFNDTTNSNVNIFNCSAYLTRGCGNNTVPENISMSGFGFYEFGVAAAGDPLGCGLSCVSTAATISFEVQDVNPADPFTSISQLEAFDGTGIYEFSAHICEENGSTGDCLESNPNTGVPEHAFVGGNDPGAIPEPQTLLLMGLGLLVLTARWIIRQKAGSK